jgi:hypothetical protein
MPTDNTKSGAPKSIAPSPKGSHEKNFWKIRFPTTREVINRAPRNK